MTTSNSNRIFLKCRPDLFCEEDLKILVDKNVRYTAVGIDPSINSTGLTLMHVNCTEILAECFTIVPNDYGDISVTSIAYNKIDKPKSNSTDIEDAKLHNANEISTIIADVINTGTIYPVTAVAIEGISMNAQFKRATSNIYDLSALNLLIRHKIKTHVFANKVIYIPPRSLKLKTTGNGSASKQEMYEHWCKDVMQDVYFKNVQKEKSHLVDVADSFAAAKEAMYDYFIKKFK
jgi:Holliday junction resolvasome RuvABC endonuclease subunit